MRASIVKRDGNKCFYCGIETSLSSRGNSKKPTDETLEHIVPKMCMDIGRNSECNLVISCRKCNEKRGNALTPEAIAAFAKLPTKQKEQIQSLLAQQTTNRMIRGYQALFVDLIKKDNIDARGAMDFPEFRLTDVPLRTFVRRSEAGLQLYSSQHWSSPLLTRDYWIGKYRSFDSYVSLRLDNAY